MSILDQRVSISNISLTTLRRLSINKDDKIRTNKLNIYYKNRIDLKN
jgi:hypothetical protein